VTLRTAISKTRVTIGDPIRYTLTVEADPGVRVILPNLGANLGAFEIRDYDVHRSKVGRRQRWTAVFTVATYDTGKFKIPPVDIYYAANGKLGSLRSQPVEIIVESLKPEAQADIKDIKPPATVKLTVWDFRWLISGVVVLLAGVIGLRLILKRRPTGALEPVLLSEPPPPPDQEALQALSDLERSRLLEEGKVKEFYTRLSDILRRYLERQFEIPALESTTAEVIASLRNADFVQEEMALVESVLEVSDLAKFAQFIPPHDRGAQGIDQVRQVVTSTTARVAARLGIAVAQNLPTEEGAKESSVLEGVDDAVR